MSRIALLTPKLASALRRPTCALRLPHRPLLVGIRALPTLPQPTARTLCLQRTCAAAVRHYSQFRRPQDPFNSRRPVANYLKPALYVAGGTALVVVAWPVLRVVVLGGAVYLAFQAFRMWTAARRIGRLMQDPRAASAPSSVFESVADMLGFASRAAAAPPEFREVARRSLRAAVERDSRLARVLEAMEPQMVEVGQRPAGYSAVASVDKLTGARRESIEVLYQVLYCGAPVPVYVRVTGVDDDGIVDVDRVVAVVEGEAGGEVELEVDSQFADFGRKSGAMSEGRRRKVQDAEYRDVD